MRLTPGAKDDLDDFGRKHLTAGLSNKPYKIRLLGDLGDLDDQFVIPSSIIR
jgi:hypothetical protein